MLVRSMFDRNSYTFSSSYDSQIRINIAGNREQWDKQFPLIRIIIRISPNLPVYSYILNITY